MNPWLRWVEVCAATLVAACVLLTFAGAWDSDKARSVAAVVLAGLWIVVGGIIAGDRFYKC